MPVKVAVEVAEDGEVMTEVLDHDDISYDSSTTPDNLYQERLNDLSKKPFD